MGGRSKEGYGINQPAHSPKAYFNLNLGPRDNTTLACKGCGNPNP
jgi:hypothetical protein